jgi:hypothetical protein
MEFCRIRSYLSTTTKNGVDPCAAIALTLAGRPWLPKVPMTTKAKSSKDYRKAA